VGKSRYYLTWDFVVEAMGLEPTNLLTASQALYQLSYAPGRDAQVTRPAESATARTASSPTTLTDHPHRPPSPTGPAELRILAVSHVMRSAG